MKLHDFLNNPTFTATRDGFGQGMVEVGEANPQVVGLSADVTESVRMLPFAQAFPQRFFDVGVAEQNLIGVAAGLALAGKIPFASSYAVFSPGRSWDQLRVSVCYSNLNVKVIGNFGGVSVGPDGATHQALEDIAMTRVLPNLTVVVPCDAEEARKAAHALAEHTGPCYLRLGREKVPNLTTLETPFEIGKALTVKDGNDCTVVACGLMVQVTLEAARDLEKQGISVRVINLHTIKPIDRETLLKAARETGAIVTAEEHQQAGGMGSAVAEVISTEHPVPMTIIGIQDTFGESGKAAELLHKYGLTSEAIKLAVTGIMKRKLHHI